MTDDKGELDTFLGFTCPIHNVTIVYSFITCNTFAIKYTVAIMCQTLTNIEGERCVMTLPNPSDHTSYIFWLQSPLNVPQYLEAAHSLLREIQ